MKGMTNAQKDVSDLATKGELALKADQSALDTKANQSDLMALQTTVAGKADDSSLIPKTNGTAGQVWTSNGSGAGSWQDPSGGGSGEGLITFSGGLELSTNFYSMSSVTMGGTGYRTSTSNNTTVNEISVTNGKVLTNGSIGKSGSSSTNISSSTGYLMANIHDAICDELVKHVQINGRFTGTITIQAVPSVAYIGGTYVDKIYLGAASSTLTYVLTYTNSVLTGTTTPRLNTDAGNVWNVTENPFSKWTKLEFKAYISNASGSFA